MKIKFVLCAQGLNLSNIRMEREENNVWVYVGNTLVSSINLKTYYIKFAFSDIEHGEKTIFFNIIVRGI